MTPPSEIKDALDQLAKNLTDQDSEMASAGFEKNDETEFQWWRRSRRPAVGPRRERHRGLE
jgi:hypothetical protein